MKKLFLSFAVLLLVVAPGAVMAAQFHSGEELSLSSTINENVYAAGALVSVSSRIAGDAMLAGSDLSVTGNVANDLFAAGSLVTVNGDVGDDLRAAGSKVSVHGTVGGETLLAGALVQVLPNAELAGDAVIAGAKVIVEGNLKGDLTVYAEEVDIRGSIAGNLKGQAGKLTIADSAKIGGKQLLELVDKKGDVRAMHAFRGFLRSIFLFGMMALLVATIVVVLLFPKRSKLVAAAGLKRFWPMVLTGLVVAIVMPAAIGILMVTGIGSALGWILLFSFLLVLALAKIYTGVLAGSLLYKWIKKPKEPMVNWWMSAIGVVLMGVLVFIPLIGWAALLLLWLASLGTLSDKAYRLVWEKK